MAEFYFDEAGLIKDELQEMQSTLYRRFKQDKFDQLDVFKQITFPLEIEGVLNNCLQGNDYAKQGKGLEAVGPGIILVEKLALDDPVLLDKPRYEYHSLKDNHILRGVIDSAIVWSSLPQSDEKKPSKNPSNNDFSALIKLKSPVLCRGSHEEVFKEEKFAVYLSLASLETTFRPYQSSPLANKVKTEWSPT